MSKYISLSQGWKEECELNAFEHLCTKSNDDQFLSFSVVYLKISSKAFALLYIFIFKEVFSSSPVLLHKVLFPSCYEEGTVKLMGKLKIQIVFTGASHTGVLHALAILFMINLALKKPCFKHLNLLVIFLVHHLVIQEYIMRIFYWLHSQRVKSVTKSLF